MDGGNQIGRVLSDLPDVCIPMRDENFVPFGEFKMVESAIKSQEFFSIFIAGESGNGKTSMVEQAAARARRELITVSVTKATRESDMIGDFRLINGNSPFYYGPVPEAMRRGAVLMLDELTQGDTLHLMALQPVLAGKALHIKKTGEIIYPAKGFCVIATGNSVGEGDESSNQVYTGEEILNEAFRDRITAVIRHTYPPKTVEIKIVSNQLGSGHTQFAESLVRWAALTRENYDNNRCDRQITTRRLLHICTNYKLFGDKLKAIELAINRFNTETYDAFRSAYFVVDPSIDPARLNSVKIEVDPDTIVNITKNPIPQSPFPGGVNPPASPSKIPF